MTSEKFGVTLPNMVAKQGPLQLPNDPIQAFEQWFEDAVQAKVAEPTAMTLATVTSDGRPRARIVLLKGVSQGGFTFFTNYNSLKAKEVEGSASAALVFHWQPMGRQVRIEGKVARVSHAESDEYFQSRARGSQIGAWSSPQSQEIDDRKELVDLVKETEERFKDGPVPRPPFWGGYRVTPDRIEFWEEREYRLHERVVYTRAGNEWKRTRLAP